MFRVTVETGSELATFVGKEHELMLQDIRHPEVKDIAVAVVPQTGQTGATEWAVHLLNLKDRAIEGVLVSSKGYGEQDGEKVRTSTLRHFLDVMEPLSSQPIEPIMEDVFHLTNEYWVSFYLDGVIYDKKFIFVPGSIAESFFVQIPILGTKGVLIA